MSDFASFRRPISMQLKRLAAAAVLLFALTAVGVQAQCQRYPAGWTYTIYSPSSGSSVFQGDNLTITWGYNYNPVYLGIYVRLEWSTNGGASWNLIQGGIAGQYSYQNSYTWAIPQSQPASTNYMVRVSEDVGTYGCWNGSYYMNEPATSGTFSILSRCATPVITTNPASSSVCVNGSKTFTVASDMTNGTYQWKLGGVTMATTSSPSYTINPVLASHAGNWTVLLTQNCNTSFTKLSSAAALTVMFPPVISKQPQPTLTICQSGRDTIKAGAVGAGKTFQWRKNGVNIPGAVDSNLILDNADATTAASYDVVVTGTCAPSVTSTACNVTVVMRPAITTEPTSLALCPGSNGQLSVVATGTALTYQWYRNNQAVTGVGNTFPFTNYSIAQDGSYYVEVTSNVPNPTGCNVKARSAIVTVTGYRPPTLLTQPVPVEGCIGKSVSLTSEFEGFGLTYSWTRNGSPIANAGSNSLLLSNLTMADAGDYRVTATATCGLTSTSNPVRVSVVKTPTFSAQPTAKDLTVGEPLNLSVAASDATKVQWFKDGVLLVGKTGLTLNIPSVTMADAGYYYATVSNACSGISSAYARVTVVDPSTLQPRLTMTPATGDLGEIPLGYEATRTFTGLISNTGNAPMVVSDAQLTLGSGFAITSGGTWPMTLNAGESTSMTIKATAENLNPMTGTLTVTTDAPVPTGELQLTATPVLRYNTPATVEYGDVFENADRDSCIQIMNNSTTDISLEQTNISGPDANKWTVTTPMPLAIAAGATADLCVKFTPGAVGTNYSAQLNFTSSTGGNTTMMLSGAGIPVVGVDELDPQYGVTVYPNPTHDVVSIRTAYASTITIVNNRGVKVATLTTSADKLEATWNTKNVNGTSVAAGTYSVRISGEQGTVTVPLVIVR